MLTIEMIREAEQRINGYVVKTPMIRAFNLDQYLGCEVYLKAECMQITGSFKLRGAMNKCLSLSKGELAAGIVASSSGNHGRAVAYTAKRLGAKASIIMPRTAPEIKINAIRALGAEIIFCEVSERHARAAQIASERGATLVPPFNDYYVTAGQGTAGIEAAEQLPDMNTLISPLSGGGLLGGISCAVKSLLPNTRVIGAEPAVLPRYTESIAAGHPVTVQAAHTYADALISQTPGEINFPIIKKYVDSTVPVSEEHIFRAHKLLITEGKVFAEPASAIGIASVMQGLVKVEHHEKVCFVLSGGNAAISQLEVLNDVII